MRRYMLIKGVLPNLVAHPSGKPLRYAGMRKRPQGEATKGFTRLDYEGPELHEQYEPVPMVFADTSHTAYLLNACKRGELELVALRQFRSRAEANRVLMSTVADTSPLPLTRENVQ